MEKRQSHFIHVLRQSQRQIVRQQGIFLQLTRQGRANPHLGVLDHQPQDFVGHQTLLLGELGVLRGDLAGYFGADVGVLARQQPPHVIFVQFFIHGRIPIGVSRVRSERRAGGLLDSESSLIGGRKKWE